MATVLVLYCSSYGHVEIMAKAVADGVRAAGASVGVKRVAETTLAEVAKAAHFKLEQRAPIAAIEDLSRYDTISYGASSIAGTTGKRLPSALDFGRRKTPRNVDGTATQELCSGAEA